MSGHWRTKYTFTATMLCQKARHGGDAQELMRRHGVDLRPNMSAVRDGQVRGECSWCGGVARPPKRIACSGPCLTRYRAMNIADYRHQGKALRWILVGATRLWLGSS